jgi:DNA adenine methylase
VIEYPKRFKYQIDLHEEIKKVQLKGKSHVYYYYRTLYNNTEDELTKASLLLFLNKTCFRGLYREGKNGFNVPFGNYKNPKIFCETQLMSLSELFKKYNIEFHCKDFKSICKNIHAGDFVYFDPPYYPLKKDSFVSYKKDGFHNQHEELVNICHSLDQIKGSDHCPILAEFRK